MKKVGSSASKKSKAGFVYKARSADAVKSRAERTGSKFDNPVVDRIDTFRPAVGENMVRILPPTWDDFDHYGYQIWVHSYVGPDSSTYLCPKRMNGDRCPICEEAARAKAAGEADEAKALEAKEQFWCWIIDRDSDEKVPTPKIYMLSWMADRDIAALCYSSRTGKVRLIDHPDEGFDLIIRRTGQGLRTRYQYQIDTDSSPLHDDPDVQDEILDYIQQNPVPSVLRFYDADYLDKMLQGEVKQKDPDDDEDDTPPRRRRSKSEDEEEEEEEKPARRRRRDKDDDDDDDKPKGRRSRDKEDEDPEEDEPPRRRRRSRDEDADEDPEEEEAPRRRRRSRDEDEEEEEEKPRRRSRSDPDEDPEEDEPPRRRRSRSEDPDEEEEEEKPRRRRSRDEDEEEEEEETPRRRRRSRDEDPDEDPEEEEEAPRRRRR